MIKNLQNFSIIAINIAILVIFFQKNNNFQKNTCLSFEIENFADTSSQMEEISAIPVLPDFISRSLAKNGFYGSRILNSDQITIASINDQKKDTVRFINDIPINQFLYKQYLSSRVLPILSISGSEKHKFEAHTLSEKITFPHAISPNQLGITINYCGPGASAIFQNTLLSNFTIGETLQQLNLVLDFSEEHFDLYEWMNIFNQLTIEKKLNVLELHKGDRKVKTLKTNGKPNLIINRVDCKANNPNQSTLLAMDMFNRYILKTRKEKNSYTNFETFQSCDGWAYSLPYGRIVLP